MKSWPVFVLTVLLVGGCASLEKHENTAKLAVSYATLKYVEAAGDAGAQAARAAKVRAIAEEVRATAKGDSVTIASLYAYVNAKLPDSISPADRLLANALISLLVTELEARVGGGLLTAEQLLAVDKVLAWVVEATGYVA